MFHEKFGKTKKNNNDNSKNFCLILVFLSGYRLQNSVFVILKVLDTLEWICA